MKPDALFEKHIKEVVERTKSALAKSPYDSAIFHSGTPLFYFNDDIEMPFRATAHFKRFIPFDAPHHIVVVSRNAPRALFIETIPEDYWEAYVPVEEKWSGQFEYKSAPTPDKAWEEAKHFFGAKAAFVGDNLSKIRATAFGIGESDMNPETLIKELNESRAVKTDYEIECIRGANERAGEGHRAAKKAFDAGMSECNIHLTFLTAVQETESCLPYPTIVCLNEKSSILHYQHKRNDVESGATFLIDAGVSEHGYASDITRSYANDSAHPVFRSLITDVETLQKKLCGLVKPGAEFIELHHATHLGIAEILKKNGITRVDGEESIRAGITRAFMPHGLGHMLGLQVHDVGGSSDEGFQHGLRDLYPNVRTNRKLIERNVTTVEPGIYFIPILLNPLRAGEHKALLDWTLIDKLIPMGGVRIEDNLVVTITGNTNLTREHLP